MSIQLPGHEMKHAREEEQVFESGQEHKKARMAESSEDKGEDRGST